MCVYTVDLYVFYMYRFIGKLTVFLQIQEFRLYNLPVTSSTTDTGRSPHLKSEVGNILVKVETLRITLNIDNTPIGSK